MGMDNMADNEGDEMNICIDHIYSIGFLPHKKRYYALWNASTLWILANCFFRGKPVFRNGLNFAFYEDGDF